MLLVAKMTDFHCREKGQTRRLTEQNFKTKYDKRQIYDKKLES